MFPDRRHRILARAMWIEMLELLDRARIPEHRLPEEIVHERMLDYFAYQLRQAWAEDDSEALGNVLVELMSVTTGLELVVGWNPPALCCGANLQQPL